MIDPHSTFDALVTSDAWPQTFQRFLARLEALNGQICDHCEELGQLVNTENLAALRWEIYHLSIDPEGLNLFRHYEEAPAHDDYEWQAALCASVSERYAGEISALQAIVADAVTDPMMQRVFTAMVSERARWHEGHAFSLEGIPEAGMVNCLIRGCILGQFRSLGPWVTLTPFEQEAMQRISREEA